MTDSFGIATAPQQVGYEDLLPVWEEADATAEIEHAWLFDHFMPIAGDISGPILEGWTALSAMAARTRRLQVGLLVTSNRFRPPAMLAKIAATVDHVSRGRLVFGIGAGSRPDIEWARREYEANGLGYLGSREAVESLDEACAIITRLWTEDEPFDFDGKHHHLVGAWSRPRPVQQPHPPILIGGQASSTLRVVARYADIWNMPGGDLDAAARRNEQLTRFCGEIGRDPAAITRSMVFHAAYDRADAARELIERARALGFSHFIVGLPAPFRPGAVRWLADEVIAPSR